MPPKRKNNVPSGTPKGRRPKIAGTRGRTTDSAKVSAPTTPGETASESTPKKPETAKPETAKPETAKPETAKPEPTKPESETVEKASADKSTDAEASPVKKSDQAESNQDKPADGAWETVATPKKVANTLPRLGARSQSTQAEPEAATKGKGESRLTWKLVAVLGVVAVVLGLFAAVAAYKPFARFDNTAWIDSSTTAEVAAAATEAGEATFSYGFETIEEDFEHARTFMNDEMRAEFDQTAETTKTAVQQTKTATKADITDIGVSMLDGDRATLLAFMNVSSTNEGTAQGSTSGSLVIDMERIDGKWVLAGIRDA